MHKAPACWQQTGAESPMRWGAAAYPVTHGLASGAPTHAA